MLIWLVFLALTATCQSAIQLPVHVNPTKTISREIAPNFVGYSLETYNAQYWFGNDTKRTKPSFVRMMNQLMQTPDQTGPIFRIGGNSGDLSIWNPDDLPLPANDTYSLKPADLIIADRAVRDIDSKVIWDVNFRNASDPSHAVAHLKAIDSLVGFESALAVEIGNECDIYTENGIRSKSYTYDQYNKEWSSYVAAIKQALPNAPIKYQGATFVWTKWYSDIAAYAKEHQDILHSVSVHNYPLTHCNGNVATIAELLTDASSQGEAQDIAKARLVQALDAIGIPLYLGEGNSVSCSGMPGVSNAFASALWALDYMFNLVSVGVQRMNFHAQPQTDSYSAVTWASEVSDQPLVQPLYYAHHVFALATRMNAQLVETTIEKDVASFLKVWSMRNYNELNVVLLHKNDTMDAVDVSISVDAPSKDFKFPNGELSTLTAPSLAEQWNVVFAGRTWMNTKNGDPIGERKVTKIVPVVDSSGKFATYTVRMVPASGAMLNIRTRGQSEPVSSLASRRRHMRSKQL